MGSRAPSAHQPRAQRTPVRLAATSAPRPRNRRRQLRRTSIAGTDPPPLLSWTGRPLDHDLDMAGDIELELDASATASDTAWIVTLQDVDASGAATPVTAGYLRAGLRQVDEQASRPGAPVIPCHTAHAVPVGEVVRYRVPLVPNARRFTAGHRIQLVITSDDQHPDAPVIMAFRHASVGTSSLNTVHSTSRLLLPVLPPARGD